MNGNFGPSRVLGCWPSRARSVARGAVSHEWSAMAPSPLRNVRAASAPRTEKPWAKTLIGGGVTIFFEVRGSSVAQNCRERLLNSLSRWLEVMLWNS